MWTKPPNPGVPLAHYRQHQGGVRLICSDCEASRAPPLEPIIARLKARGVGGENTGIRAVAQFVREAYPQCGGQRFETWPWFPPTPKGEGWMAPDSTGERSGRQSAAGNGAVQSRSMMS